MPHQGWFESVTLLYSNLWPSLLGAVVALYFHPPESTRLDRLFAGIASVAVSVLFGPATNEWFGVDSKAVEGAIYGVLALFGLTVAAQIFAALRELGLTALLREWLRRVLGLGGGA